jgi:hypothetical protein
VIEKENAAKKRTTASQATAQLAEYAKQIQDAREREAGRAVAESWGIVEESARRRQRILKNRPVDRLTNFHGRNVIRAKMAALYASGLAVPVSSAVLKATLRGERDPRLSLLASIANGGGAPVGRLAEALAASATGLAVQRRRQSRATGNSRNFQRARRGR